MKPERAFNAPRPRVKDFTLAKSDRHVERVKTNSNNTQQNPKKDAAPKLEAVTVKCHTITVDVSVALLPLQESASAERSSDAEGNCGQKCIQKTSTNVAPETTCKFRSHNKVPFLKNIFTLSRNFIVSHQFVFVNSLFVNCFIFL